MILSSSQEPIRIAVLGSTGSIGRQVLDVVRANPHLFEVVALAAGSDAELLMSQAKEFKVKLLALASGSGTPSSEFSFIEGEDSAERLVRETDASVVVNAVVGAAGLKATMATILSEKILALANKESLVAAGELVMSKSSPGQLRPVDSEHSALWQVLEGVRADQVRKVVLTGSGGPFRGKEPEELGRVTVAEALNHPVWDMGPKITIDSATLMNKGLEVIEAHFLFGFTYDEIEVLIHPDGLIHGMVELIDGSVLAHAALPDMRLPIQVALGWPDRLPAPAGRVDWVAASPVTFERPETGTFKCLELAFEAGRQGGTCTAALNAANEVAVNAFIEERIGFLEIPEVIDSVMQLHDSQAPDLEGVLEADRWARVTALESMGQRA